MNQPLILQFKGNKQDEFLVVDKSPFEIGRRPENDLQISQKDVSGLHAKLCFEDGGWWVVDNQSTNGTFVNGNRITGRVKLNLKDILHFASKGFEVVPSVAEEEEEEPAAMATQMLGDSSDIRGMVDLVNIISEQRTYPVWQPIVSLETNGQFGWEALGRGVSSDGPTPPGTLFRLASQSNVEVKLSELFRESAVECAVCRHCWPDIHKPHLFFNLHPDEAQEDLYREMIEVLSDSELTKSYQIVLEIHESLVCNSGEMQVLVKQSRDAGVLIAYDDFGAGQSRIPDLISVPPDFLKLDRSLISGLDSEKVKQGIVKALVNACHELNVTSLAEGIETEEELGVCLDMGVELGQGFLMCKPKPPFVLFGTDSTSLPERCPYIRLDILSHFPTDVIPGISPSG